MKISGVNHASGIGSRLVVLVLLGAILAGCSNGKSEQTAAPPREPAKLDTNPNENVAVTSQVSPPVAAANSNVAPKKLKTAIPLTEAPPITLHVPLVVMSDAHAKSCRVKIGDALPAFVLPDRPGVVQSLAPLFGEKLTVVVFWNSRVVFAREQFQRLQHDVVDRYSQYGVSVIAVAVGETASEVQRTLGSQEISFPCLVDQSGDALRHVATGKLPRTYLLDAEGRILWLDIEYSRTTERELDNAIFYSLRPPGSGEGRDGGF